MRTPIKAALMVGAFLSVLAAGSWFAAPAYIKHRVNETPGVTVESVSLHAWHIKLHHVAVQRDNLQASLPSVTIDSNEEVTVHGGNVTIDKKAASAPTSATESRHKIRFENLHVTLNGVLADTPIDLENVSGTPSSTITVERAIVRHKFGTVTANSVRSDHGLSSETFRAEFVEVHGFRPLPTDPCAHMTFEGVDLARDQRSVHIETAVCGGNRADGLQVGWDNSWITARSEALVVSHPWLNPVPLVLNYPVQATWNAGVLDLFVGESREQARLAVVVSPERKHMDIRGTCAEIATRMPPGLAEPLKGIDFQGNLDIHIIWDPKDPDVTIKGMCRAACASPLLRALRRPFTYRPYTSTWERKPRQSGPGTAQWVPLGTVSENLINATIAREDPGFLAHRGYIPQAFRNSLRMNLDKGRFAHGGSTITMQLAKNLWLSRDKTFGRKAQELLLAAALESCYGKDDILELYLNVVEFGPDLYGIGPAAQKWFQVSPAALTPRQAFWLASILPRPRGAVQPDEAVLARTEKLIKRMVEAGHLPESMREDIPEGALDEW